MAPPIVKSRIGGASAQIGPQALSRSFLGARSGGIQRKARKARNANGIQCFAGGLKSASLENRKLGNGKLAEASLCEGVHVVHICNPGLELSRGGSGPPRTPHRPIDPSEDFWETSFETI